MKKLFLSLAILYAGSASADLAEIKNKDKITIGVFGDKPPFGYLDTNGQHQGFDVEIAKYLAYDLFGDANKIEFVITDAANRVEYLKSGKVDLILANFTNTKERARIVDFASPYMKVAIGIVSPASAPITNIEELKDKTLLVNQGTAAAAFFTKKYPKIKLLKFEHNTETFENLKTGQGVGVAHDNAMLWAWAKDNPDFVVGISSIGNVDYIAPAVPKGNPELLNWVNGEIAKLKADGRLKRAYEKTLLPVYGDKVKPEELLAD